MTGGFNNGLMEKGSSEKNKKVHVYTSIDEPTLIDTLEVYIEAIICEIFAEILEEAPQNLTKLIDHLRYGRVNICLKKSSNLKLYGPYYQFK